MRHLGLLIALTGFMPHVSNAQESEILHPVAFAFRDSVVVTGNPDTIYDKLTGDVSPWWDHTMSEKPAAFYLEPSPGGGFWEYFDDERKNGVRHAVVIYADRGRVLRFDGPLGLSGYPIQTVTTYELEQKTDSTLFRLTVRGSGAGPKNIGVIVQRVWHHFLHDRFAPYANGTLTDH